MKKLQSCLKISCIVFILLFLLNSNIFSIDLNKTITLNLKNADIRNILVALAREEKINLVLPPQVSGNVTIFLDNVTIGDALKIITNIVGFSYYVKNNIIFVDKQANIEKVVGRKEGYITRTFSVNFAKATDLQSKVKELLSSDGKVITDERTNTLIITDTEINLNKVENFLKTLDVSTPQVMIEAKIIIIRNDARDELGIQWGGSLVKNFTSNNFFYGIKGGATSSDIISTDFPNASGSTNNVAPISVPSEYVVNLPTVSPPVAGLGLIFGKWGYYNLSVKLTALKTKNLAREIASPKVLALDNEKASIGQGLEIPYKSVSDSGTDTQFKDAKLKLEVTPHITSNNMISLDLNLTKDSIGQMTTDGPAINTQEINTKLLLKDGETAVIGGIVGNTVTEDESKVPFFGDLPLLGVFFKNKINSNSRGELLIFITPKIVRRTVIN